MKFEFFFEMEENFAFALKVYANKKTHRWESGGAFGTDWSEIQWYEGLIVISKEGTKWYFSFETYQVRDSDISELNHQFLFGDMSSMEILNKCERLSQISENQPFPFVKIDLDFK